MTSVFNEAAPADFHKRSGLDRKPEAALTAEFVQRGRDRALSTADRPEHAPSTPTEPPVDDASAGDMAGSARPPAWWHGVAVFLAVFVVGFAATLFLLGVIPDLIDFVIGVPPQS